MFNEFRSTTQAILTEALNKSSKTLTAHHLNVIIDNVVESLSHLRKANIESLTKARPVEEQGNGAG